MALEGVTYWINILQGVVFLMAIASGLYGFWTGKLQFWIGGLIKWRDSQGNEVTLPDITQKIDRTYHQVDRLEEQHNRMARDMDTVKLNQFDIAKVASGENGSIDMKELERRNFGEESDRPGDLLKE